MNTVIRLFIDIHLACSQNTNHQSNITDKVRANDRDYHAYVVEENVVRFEVQIFDHFHSAVLAKLDRIIIMSASARNAFVVFPLVYNQCFVAKTKPKQTTHKIIWAVRKLKSQPAQVLHP